MYYFIFSGDHVECVTIHFDPSEISYKQILQIFWNNHSFTTRVKRRYTSLILYHSDVQKTIARKSMEKESIKCTPQQIITNISRAGPFYPAEEWDKNLHKIFWTIFFLFSQYIFSHHQKFRLQANKDFVKTLQLNSELLLTSYVAAKLNGFLGGYGGIEEFEKQVEYFGLTSSQENIIREHLLKNTNVGPSCRKFWMYGPNYQK